MKTIEDCPFCGDVAFLCLYTGDDYSAYYIECNGCGIESPDFDTEGEAISYWNHREDSQ